MPLLIYEALRARTSFMYLPIRLMASRDSGIQSQNACQTCHARPLFEPDAAPGIARLIGESYRVAR